MGAYEGVFLKISEIFRMMVLEHTLMSIILFLISVCIRNIGLKIMKTSDSKYLVLTGFLTIVAIVLGFVGEFILRKSAMYQGTPIILCASAFAMGVVSLIMLIEYLALWYELTNVMLIGMLIIAAIILGLIGKFILHQNTTYGAITSLLLLGVSLVVWPQSFGVRLKRWRLSEYVTVGNMPALKEGAMAMSLVFGSFGITIAYAWVFFYNH